MSGLITRLFERPQQEQRGATPLQPWGNTAPPPNSSLGMNTAGVTVSDQTAMQLAAVWASASIICDSIAALPIRQYRATGPRTAKEMTPAPVVHQPWSEVSRRTYVSQGTWSFLLRGNLYGQITARDAKLYPEQVKLVHPDHARVKRVVGGPKAGQIEVSYHNHVVPPDTVSREMGLAPPEALVGLNPIEYMRNVFGLARAQDLYGGAFYANSARPDGVIKVKGDLDPEQAKQMKQTWLESQQGINHSHLPAVLTGTAEFQPITMSMADVQFLAQMEFSASVISGMIYRVPPHMIGIMDKSTSWGAGIEQQELGFVRNTLGNWLGRWEDLITSWLPPREFVMFDLSQRLRGDTLQRWAAYQVARVIGAMNNAEIREAENLPLVDDPEQAAVLENFAQPFNSSPVPAAVAQGGDKAN